MTVTYTDASGGTLPSAAAARGFVCTRPLAYACVRLVPSLLRPGLRSEEVIYRDGAFRYPYLRSTVDSNVYSIVRDGGWPRDIELHAEEAGFAPAALQPLDGDVVAAWSLLADRTSAPMVTPGTDRSGHGLSLGTPNSNYSIPDLIPGESCQQMIGALSNGGMLGSSTQTALKILGELTVTLRVWCPGYQFNAPGYLWSQSNYNDSSQAGNCIGSLVVNDTQPRIAYFAMNGAGRTSVVGLHTVPLTRAAWNFISLRRNAAGTSVTVGINNVNQTFTGLLPPTGGGNSFVALGTSSFGAERPNCGMADVVIRNVSRSDADLTAWYKIAMGL